MNIVMATTAVAVSFIVGATTGSKLEQLVQAEQREIVWRQCHEHAYSDKSDLSKMNDCLEKAFRRIK